MESIAKNADDAVSGRDRRKYRLAALIHDIGHYPFSHSMEHAIENYYSESYLTDSSIKAVSSGTSSGLSTPAPYVDHESMGEIIIEHDEEIASILKSNGIELDDVTEIFGKFKPGSLAHLISSDLDCDRLDYLMRTAHFAGMPYGKVDLGYVIGQATVDRGGNFAFRQKALKAADHLLISRFFDYQQIPFHKTVVAIEIMLQRAIVLMLKLNIIDCHRETMKKKIANRKWAQFDDAFMLEKMRQSLGKDAELTDYLEGILHRKPMKLFWCDERYLHFKDIGTYNEYKESILIRIAELKLEVESKYGLPQYCWELWQPEFGITKMAGKNSNKDLDEDEEADDPKSVRLLTHRSAKFGGDSKPIRTFEASMIRPLHESNYRYLRLYALLPSKYAHLREKIQEIVYNKMS